MAKRAFFIIGPEGCGTYMLAEAFVSAGCEYVDEEDVSKIKVVDPRKIVLRRSIPHAGKWYGVEEVSMIRGQLEHLGYDEIVLVFIIRDMYCAQTSVSNRKVSHASDYRWAIDAIVSLMSMWTHILITYEGFVLSEAYRAGVFGRLGLPAPEKMEFYDGNEKYFK